MLLNSNIWKNRVIDLLSQYGIRTYVCSIACYRYLAIVFFLLLLYSHVKPGWGCGALLGVQACGAWRVACGVWRAFLHVAWYGVA